MAASKLIGERPSPAEYAELRRLMGWGEIDDETARVSVDAAVFSVCLRADDRLLGLARVAGDGVLYFYISDVILLPELRGSGHGTSLMKSVIDYLAKAAKPGATITVAPMKGREKFYERFGFKLCPNELLGAGLFLPASLERELAPIPAEHELVQINVQVLLAETVEDLWRLISGLPMRQHSNVCRYRQDFVRLTFARLSCTP